MRGLRKKTVFWGASRWLRGCAQLRGHPVGCSASRRSWGRRMGTVLGQDLGFGFGGGRGGGLWRLEKAASDRPDRLPLMGSPPTYNRSFCRAARQGVGWGAGPSYRNAHTEDERSRGRSLLHGQDTGKTQNHRNSIEQWLAVGGGWRLAAVGGWRLVAVGGWRLVVLGICP